MEAGKSRGVIEAGRYAVVKLPSEGLKIVELRSHSTVNLGKFGSFKVDGVLGYSYGQAFEIIDDRNVRPIKSLMESEPTEIDTEEEEITKDKLTELFTASSESNQNIIDIGSKIQKLSNEEIDNLKKSGASSEIGQKIIEQMIAGHEGFDKKTVFSQQKYLRRKQQKFLRRFSVEYLSSTLMLQYYIEKDLPRVLDISPETLGLLMTYGNVRPGGNYLLLDETGGVILYAMLERMIGQGTVLVLHENEHANLNVMKYSNLSEEETKLTVKTASWLLFIEPDTQRIEWQPFTQEEIDQLPPAKKTKYYRRHNRALEINDTLDLIQNGNFDGFISVSTLSMPSVLPYVLDRVGGSRAVAIYNQFKENLLETQHFLQVDKRILAPSIIESRVRPYQTIPGRMHPVMTMRGYGGYVLWGTRVFPAENIQAIGRGMSNKKKNMDRVSS
ncbi:tRNA (adenine(58)-N(1))-methyltransferase non-catalytic subunit trm6 [Scheffersomyces spartinae]|uniref:tRNA (adenine(58)-N(1))-methyltransferase non-catalytic subunit TRM6 n=1 Tax=Scheffersomyces spartinae TaxID=45513 RepID=A0A9P8AH55_9ASCO|nr:tRNA (adenine(58)-N(1))-methyltransferase non-catalytic subunit trm6 [Scheffersomyces spartinae]KAG7192146.1 tRNA (adenine(58)-N(1))-methyltransferase non-catalytic subunit trm6 [Scheffersomyces spartinae]